MTNDKLESKLFEEAISLIRKLSIEGEIPRDLSSAVLTPDTKLQLLGLDSLAEMTLLAAFDEHFGVYIPDEILTEDLTVGTIANLVASVRRQT